MTSRMSRGFRRARRAAARRIRRPAAALRTLLLVRVFLPRRTKAGRLHYAAVLDGQTVNLHAELPGTLSFPGEAEIELVQGRTRYTAPARIYQDADGRLLCDVAVLLGEGAGGLPVGDGESKVRLHLRSGSRSRRIPLVLTELPEPYDGPTKPYSVSPVTGQRHRLGRSATGNLRIVTTTVRAMAEVVRIDLFHTGLAVEFRVLGAPPANPRVDFVARGRRLTAPVEYEPNGVWRVAVPLDQMSPGNREQLHWDVMVHGDSGPVLRVGRRLHDVRNPQRVFTIASTTVAPGGGEPMIVHPRYTPAGNFRVTCRRMPESGRRT
jgi:hypothetical protein